MPSPYNLEVFYNCIDCGLREDRQFCQVSPTALEVLNTIKFTGVYPKGSLLFVEGEEPRGVFILCSGRVKLTASSGEGKRIIIRLVDPGEVIGLSSAILGMAYELSAETLEPCQVNFIKRTDFVRYLEQFPDACLNVARQLSEKYRSAQRELRSFGLSYTASEKLARLLLEWCDTSGEETPRGVRLKVLLTHEEIAQMIGATRETVTRLFSDLKRKHVIDIKGSTLMILQRRALENVVHA